MEVVVTIRHKFATLVLMFGTFHAMLKLSMLSFELSMQPFELSTQCFELSTRSCEGMTNILQHMRHSWQLLSGTLQKTAFGSLQLCNLINSRDKNEKEVNK